MPGYRFINASFILFLIFFSVYEVVESCVRSRTDSRLVFANIMILVRVTVQKKNDNMYKQAAPHGTMETSAVGKRLGIRPW